MPAKDIYLNNSYEYVFAVVGPNPQTGVRGPRTGLTDVVGFLSTSKDGSTGPIHTDLQLAATEYSGKLGTYHATLSKAAVNLRLTGLVGTSVYLIGVNADADSYSKVKILPARPSA